MVNSKVILKGINNKNNRRQTANSIINLSEMLASVDAYHHLANEL